MVWHEQVPICDAKSPLMIEINHQRIQKLTEMIDECFARVKGSIKDMSPSLRKILCQWIRTLPHDSMITVLERSWTRLE